MSGSKAAAAGAVGGKAARACDSCLRRRARWYCAADDAFLCQCCDASVHSANPLARRHERLRLRPTSPSKHHHSAAALEASTSTKRHRQQVAPAWSKRKARTRRPQVKSVGQLLSRKLVVVPEVTAVESPSSEQKAEEEEEEEQLLYRVPTFDRALAELCSPPSIDDSTATAPCCREDDAVEHKKGVVVAESPVQQLPDSFAGGFGPTDAELREFAADMEALLGQGLDDGNELDESFYMESLGLMTMPPPAEDAERRVVKMEADSIVISPHSEGGGLGGCDDDPAELRRPEESAPEVLDIDFNYCSSPTVIDKDDDEDDCLEQKASASNGVGADAQFFKRSLDLRLDYESIIDSWGSSPWTDGHRPNVQLDDFWPHPHHHSGMWMAGGGRLGGGEGLTPRLGMMGGGREARVSRYREKRRTRLFAKKIRYEVRKLNAEKRPRMKGRFVKRPAAAGAAAAAAAPCAVTT